jgi:hypothetical protein
MVARVRGKQILRAGIYHGMLLERSPLGALVLCSAQYTETLAQGVTITDDRLMVDHSGTIGKCELSYLAIVRYVSSLPICQAKVYSSYDRGVTSQLVLIKHVQCCLLK